MNSENSKKPMDQLRPSSYDGIQEYDNDLPRWWVWLFYLTGVYALVYIVGNYGFDIEVPPVPHRPVGVVAATGPAAGSQAPADAGDDVVIMRARLNDSAFLAKGKDLYVSRCAPCHGPQGGGVIGPNLTDENGVTEKGMLAWKSMLSQDDIRAVTVYIRSLRGTNPAGAKGPEGEVYTGEE
jgi:cytochrome c oxidase cbb3-type subunit 3